MWSSQDRCFAGCSPDSMYRVGHRGKTQATIITRHLRLHCQSDFIYPDDFQSVLNLAWWDEKTNAFFVSRIAAASESFRS